MSSRKLARELGISRTSVRTMLIDEKMFDINGLYSKGVSPLEITTIQTMIWQQDGGPSHYGQVVRDYLDDTFEHLL